MTCQNYMMLQCPFCFVPSPSSLSKSLVVVAVAEVGLLQDIEWFVFRFYTVTRTWNEKTEEIWHNPVTQFSELTEYLKHSEYIKETKTQPKGFMTKWKRVDLKWSVGITIATQLACVTGVWANLHTRINNLQYEERKEDLNGYDPSSKSISFCLKHIQSLIISFNRTQWLCTMTRT